MSLGLFINTACSPIPKDFNAKQNVQEVTRTIQNDESDNKTNKTYTISKETREMYPGLPIAADIYLYEVEQKPKDINTYLNLAQAYNSNKLIDMAHNIYKKAVTEIDPQSIKGHIAFGDFLAKEHLLNDAIDSYNKAIEIDPKNFEAINNIGVCYYNTDEMEKSIEYFNKALKINPSYKISHQNLSKAYGKIGEENLAEQHKKKGKGAWTTTLGISPIVK